MLPPIKYQKVNWQNGMKISQKHFIQMENAFEDQVRDIAGAFLTSHNYGLIPPGPNARQSVDIQLSFDKSEIVTVKVLECRGITPGGARIEITQVSKPLTNTLSLDGLKKQAYELYISVDPFHRVPAGQPDAEESPIRQPYTQPLYQLDVLPFPQTHQPEYSAFHLCIGRLEIEGERVKLSDHYIPPCIYLNSHPRMIAAHRKLLSQLGEAEVSVAGILQRIHGKKDRLELDNSLFYLVDKIGNHLALSMDDFKFFLLYQPPVYIIKYFATFARVLQLSLHSMVRQNKEELLDYFHKWMELAPREMENLLRTMLSVSYDHNDIFTSLNKCEFFAERITFLLRKLNDLNYIDKPLQKDITYGWLVVHTEGRKGAMHRITKESIVVGRTAENSDGVDFSINDDTWVSRNHARISVIDERGERMYKITDLNSINGTYIHDTKSRIKPSEEFSLMDGDTFQVGKTNIYFKSAAAVTSEKELTIQIQDVPYFKISNIMEAVEG